MGEVGTRLRPDDAEVSHTTVVYLGKNAVEDVAEHVQCYTSHDGLTASITEFDQISMTTQAPKNEVQKR